MREAVAQFERPVLLFSVREGDGHGPPNRQRPELWPSFNARLGPGEHMRVFPISNWTELDVWRYIEREELAVPSIYFAHRRRVFRRDGMWLAVGQHMAP